MGELPVWVTLGTFIALVCVIVMILIPNLFCMIADKIGGRT